MNFPEDLKYSKEHEWVRINGNMATIGITDYAQDQLGEVVFVELPAEGEELQKNDTFGVVESVKSVSDVFSPLSGKVIEVNDPLSDTPETVNEDPYGEGWLVKVEVTNPKELGTLMSAEHYQAFIKEES
ncbi:MAG: glycine cleavage system protein GcvH [Deltaproteobacteria bacterium]|nr:glycine cleavage system protein GcvH [Deltaproteobacteria bacterium]MBI2501200.1 glycine cleavage system protein GcvH [Deltaproteobacteria bacterium]